MKYTSDKLLNDYSLFVRSLAEKKENRVFLNSDEDKMLSVFTQMFQSSTKEFRIFAGNLCNKTTNAPQYIESLSDYIEKDGFLRILLNKFNDEEIKSSDLFKRLAFYKSIGKDISVKTTQEEPYILEGENKKPVHFAVGDKESYRIETDIEARKAICNMNDPKQSGALIQLFDRIFNGDVSHEIDLLALFNIK